MQIDITQVQRIAGLARLSIDEQEKETLGRELSGILGYIEKLNELDTQGVEPTSHVLDITNVMRDDTHRASLTEDEALANSPDRVENFYRVPAIIE